MTLDPDEVYDPFTITNTFELDLEKIEKTAWAYPLPGAKVISPYGGKRRHSGVDLKTCPNDEIVAALAVPVGLQQSTSIARLALMVDDWTQPSFMTTASIN